MTEQVAYRLRRIGLVGRTVSIKVRFANFKTLTRSSTLEEPTNVTRRLSDETSMLLSERLPRSIPPVRLLGLGVTGLDAENRQRDLFGDQTRDDEDIDTAVDAIRERFGRFELTRGSSLGGQ